MFKTDSSVLQSPQYHKDVTLRQSTLSIALSVVIAVAGCRKEEPKAPARPAVDVTVTPVVLGPVDRTADIVGTLYGDEEVVLSAKVAGRMTEVSADVGDRVSGGAKLAQIDPIDYQLEVTRRQNAVREALAKLGLTDLPKADFDVTKVATVERARSQADNAQARMERARKLFEQKPPLISEQDFADLQTAMQVAQRDFEVAKLDAQSQLAMVMSRQSELAAAQEQLSNTQIIAPPTANGRKFAVAQRSVSTGEYVKESTALYRLVLDDKIKFRGALPERYAGQVTVGQTVVLRVENLADPVRGEVSRVSPSINTDTRTFQVEAIFDNASFQLRAGGFARGVVIVGQDPNVPLVAREAISSFAGVDKLFSVKDGQAVEHLVKLGANVDGLVAIPEGLANVSEVIVGGKEKLAGKVPVNVTGQAKLPATKPSKTSASQPTTSPTTQSAKQ